MLLNLLSIFSISKFSEFQDLQFCDFFFVLGFELEGSPHIRCLNSEL